MSSFEKMKKTVAKTLEMQEDGDSSTSSGYKRQQRMKNNRYLRINLKKDKVTTPRS